MYFNIHAIMINKESYRSGLNLTKFFKYLLFVFLRGESPIENRPAYARKSRRY
jgi:hypothetical protein